MEEGRGKNVFVWGGKLRTFGTLVECLSGLTPHWECGVSRKVCLRHTSEDDIGKVYGTNKTVKNS